MVLMNEMRWRFFWIVYFLLFFSCDYISNTVVPCDGRKQEVKRVSFDPKLRTYEQNIDFC